jgi:hypothetical protein
MRRNAAKRTFPSLFFDLLKSRKLESNRSKNTLINPRLAITFIENRSFLIVNRIAGN